MTELPIRQRIAYWDNAKGILIVLVVLGHYLHAYLADFEVSFVVSMIYTFHMPAFVLISGYFSRGEKASSVRAMVRLTAAYLIFNTLMMLYTLAAEGGPLSLTQPYNSYWYLLALIIWRITVKYVSKIRGIMAVSIIIALLIGFSGEITNEFALARVICFYPFFLAGYKLTEEKAAALIERRTPADFVKGILLLIVSLGLTAAFVLCFRPPIGVFQMEAYPSTEFMLYRLIVLVLASVILAGLSQVIPSKPVSHLSGWGQNSLAIYVLHRPVSLLFVTFFPEEGVSNLYIMWALLAGAATLLILGSAPVTRVLNAVLNRIADIVCEK